MTTYTPAQIAAMTVAQLNALSAATISSLTAADVQALSATQLAGLSKTNFQALNLSYCLNSQIASLGAASAANVTSAQIQGFSTAQIASLSTAALNALPAADLAALSKAQEQALTVTQISGLSTTAFGALNLANLLPAQCAGVTAAQTASLSVASFDRLALSSLSASAFAGVSAADIQSLTTAQIAALSSAQLNGLSPAALAGLTKAQEQALTVTQISGLSTTAFNALNIANLLPAQLAGVTGAQVAGLSTANFDLLAPSLGALKTVALSGVTVTELQSLTAAQVNGLSATVVGALSSAASAYVKDYQGVYSELAKVVSGGALTFAGAQTLLQAEAVGGDSAGKFAAFTAIAKGLNTSGNPTANAMVAQLFDDVVQGNSFNATWTGGGSSSVALGNLSAASTQTQFNELIGKWFLGTDNPTVSNVYSSTYQTQSGPLFSGTPTYAQVNQGAVGDCYFESAMAATADFDPSLIQNMITSDGNGVYTVDFYNNASNAHDYITVNSQMAVMPSGYSFASGSHLTFDNGGASGAIWSEVMEKAFVEFCAQTGEYSGGNAYTSIAGGWDNGLQAITGQAISDYTPAGDTTAQLTALLNTCSTAMKSGDAVMMNDNNANSALHLVGDHMYNVLSVNAAAGTVTIDNPWNANGFSGGVGETFTDSIASLASAGVTFHVATGTARAG